MFTSSHLVHDQHPASGRERVAAVAEQARALRVVPVVDDVLHEVGVGARGHGLEEAPAHHLAALAHLRCADEAARRCARDDLRLVVEHAAQLLVAAQDGREQVAVRSTDVDQVGEAPERVRARDRVVLDAGDAGHRGRELAVLLGVRAQVLEDRHPELQVERRLPGAHRVGERHPGADVVVVDHHQREVAERTACAAAQRRPDGGELEAPALVLGAHADGRERAQHPVQVGGIGADLFGELARAERAPAQCVRHPEPRHGEHHRRDPVAADQCDHRVLRALCARGRLPAARARRLLPHLVHLPDPSL